VVENAAVTYCCFGAASDLMKTRRPPPTVPPSVRQILKRLNVRLPCVPCSQSARLNPDWQRQIGGGAPNSPLSYLTQKGIDCRTKRSRSETMTQRPFSFSSCK